MKICSNPPGSRRHLATFVEEALAPGMHRVAQWTAVDTTEWRVLGRAQCRVSRGYAEHYHVNHPWFNLLPLPEVMGYGYLNKCSTLTLYIPMIHFPSMILTPEMNLL